MNIKLNNKNSADLSVLIESKLLIQANAGGGKSWAIRRIVEQSFGKVPIIILDVEGEFASLREKYDFVLIGKDGDLNTDVRSAATLARKLMELNVSAIIDLYDLPPADRKHFVRLFFESLIDIPKDLYGPRLIILDEAHWFCPEKGQAESAQPVIDLMARGRKRGFGVILATQRLSKLHKDAAAECNNKLIGRTSLDIDMKRAYEELGFNTKEQYQGLRQLTPGEFFAFGPAISNEVITLTIGAVETAHPKSGSRLARGSVARPATSKIKGILARLGDIPAAARVEADSIAGLRDEIKQLKAQKSVQQDPRAVDIANSRAAKTILEATQRAERTAREHYLQALNERSSYIDHLEKIIKSVARNVDIQYKIFEPISKIPKTEVDLKIQREQLKFKPDSIIVPPGQVFVADKIINGDSLPTGEKKVLAAIAQYPEGTMTRETVSILTGYKRASRNTYISRLMGRGYVVTYGDKFIATPEGMAALGPDFERLPTGVGLRAYWLNNLPEGEKKIFAALTTSYPSPMSREDISSATGYLRASRNTYISRLNTRQLLKIEGSDISLADQLYE